MNTCLVCGIETKNKKFCSCRCSNKGRTGYTQKKKTPTELFFKHVQITDSCWLWTGALDGKGYGVGYLHGKTMFAHRVAYHLFKGDPGTFAICHHCDNPPCVNPEHLFAGTQLDNLTDMVQKGRSCVGERNSQARLTETDVKLIKERLKSGETQRSIAQSYNINDYAIWAIKHGKTWRHVS